MGRRTKTTEVSRQNSDAAMLAAEEILSAVIETPKNTQLKVARDALRHNNNGDDTFVHDTLRTLRERLKE